MKAVASLLLFAGVVAYLAALPPNLGIADESYFLLEAKRMVEGEVLYKDLFWLALPLPHWLMALVFGTFGATVQVARLAMAVLHGLTAVLMFLACRRIGVRAGLALVAPIAYVALCQAPWPYASPHWLSTFWMVLLLLVLLGRRWAAAPAGAALPGLVIGALMAGHHHQGAVFALGVSLLVVLDAALGRRFGAAPPAGAVLPRLAAFAGGVALVVGPVLAVAIAAAGVRPLVEQIIVHPLTGYRRWNRGIPWGHVHFVAARQAPYTHPVVLRYLPVVLLLDLWRASAVWVAGRDPDTFRRLLVLLVMGASAVASIAYLPDFIHIAFITPLLLVPAAGLLEAAAARGPRVGGAALAALLLGALAVQLAGNAARARRDFPFEHDTAFGRVAFATREEVAFVDRVRALVRDVPGHWLFVAPIHTQLYLTTGASNPTRHQFVLPDYLGEEETRRLLATLEGRQLPYVVACEFAVRPGDPVQAWLRERYTPLADRASTARRCTVYARTRGTGD